MLLSVCQPEHTAMYCFIAWGTQILALYTYATREMQKKGGLFFEPKRDSQESRLEVKRCQFSRKGVIFGFY